MISRVREAMDLGLGLQRRRYDLGLGFLEGEGGARREGLNSGGFGWVEERAARVRIHYSDKDAWIYMGKGVRIS